MIDLHPPLSAMPLGLIVLAALLEAYCLLRPSAMLAYAAGVNLVAAAIFSLAAFFSGYGAAESANRSFQISNEVISQHHSFGRLLLFAIIPCAALKVISTAASHGKATFRGIYLLFLAISVGLVLYTGYLGGRLVFIHGAGVSASMEQQP